jgi:hypothetical protein
MSSKHLPVPIEDWPTIVAAFDVDLHGTLFYRNGCPLRAVYTETVKTQFEKGDVVVIPKVWITVKIT